MNIIFPLSFYFFEARVTFFRLLFTNNLICTPTKVENNFPTMKVISTRYFVRRTSQTWIVTKWISHDATISIYITDCKESGDKAVSFFVYFIHYSVFSLPSSDLIARPFNRLVLLDTFISRDDSALLPVRLLQRSKVKFLSCI